MFMLTSSRLRVFQSVSVVFLLGIAFPLLKPEVTIAAERPKAAAIETDYVLGAGDQIEISVFGYQEFNGPKTVLPDGTIALPVVGSVMASDRTPKQLAAELKARLDPYLVDPVVSVIPATLRPVVVNIAGEVQRPGPIQLRSLTATAFRSNNPDGTNTNTTNTTTGGLEGVPTLSSALVEAGGVTQKADIRQVVLRRALPGGQTQSIKVNLWDAIWSDRQPEDLILRPGDSIFVPKLADGTQLDRRLIARSRLSPSTVRVRVVGEVNKPGEIQISPASSLSSAIASAGGFTKEARGNSVQLVRLNENGRIDTQEINLSKLNDNLQVQDGDVVVVPERGRSSFLRVLGQVLSPFGSLLNLFRGF
jgi:polysaccharide export outer membrane protein